MNNQTTSQYWGYHTLIDAAKCDLDKITNPVVIADFARVLVERLDMEAFGEPQVFHFGKDDKAGWTLVQMITTSNIVAHFNDCDGTAYLDVFSCKPYNMQIVIDLFEQTFSPVTIKPTFLIRQA